MSPEQELQKQLDNSGLSEVRWVDRGETRGTIVVRRRVTLDLTRTTLVGDMAPAIVVSRGGDLLIKGGQVSTSGRDTNAVVGGVAGAWRVGTAIEVEQGGSVRFESVDVVGDVAGASPLAGEWHLPVVLPLPNLPPRTRNTVRVRCILPHEVEVGSDIEGVAPTQNRVGPGPVELGLDIDARDAEPGVLLDGWIRFAAHGLVRRMRLRVRMVQGSPEPTLGPVWQSELYEDALREHVATKAPAATPPAPVAPPTAAPTPSVGEPPPATPVKSSTRRPTAGSGGTAPGSGLGGAFFPKPTVGTTAASAPADAAASASSTPLPPPVPIVWPPLAPPSLPPSGGLSEERPAPKSTGLSPIFRPGSARIDLSTPAVTPAPASPAASSGEPIGGVVPPIAPGAPASEAGSSTEKKNECPSREQKPDGSAQAGEKKTDPALSPIFRRGKPNS